MSLRLAIRRPTAPVALLMAACLLAGPAPGARAEDPSVLPFAAALGTLAASEDEALAAFYADRLGAPLFIDADGRPAAAGHAVLEAGARAADHALPPSRYALAGAGEESSPEALARRELELARIFLRYARDVSSGLLEPGRVDREIKVRPERPDPAVLLSGMAGAADPAAYLAGLAPDHPDYALLQAELADYLRLARSDAWAAPLPGGPTIREGDRSPRVEDLRRRLIAMGDLEPADLTGGADGVEIATSYVASDLVDETGDPRHFSGSLATAVRRFQARHGLNEDGIVGPATLEAVNASPADRARQIAVNLERIRWLNRDLGDRHVIVNLAGFEMALVEDGATVFTSRVVIGKAYRHRTPEFSDEMEHMVVNPTWYVPSSIAREEILPALQADPTYLQRKNMRLSGADPAAIDWTQVTPSTFPGRVSQGPGPGNALGRVKFMFPNDHAIYLHDTPQRHLFRRDRRAYSHGCVRVAKPMEFAQHLLEGQVDDPAAFVQAYVDRGREVYVHLDAHIPVHITYRTAWVGEDGSDQFRSDVYGRDERVFAALEDAGLVLDGL